MYLLPLTPSRFFCSLCGYDVAIVEVNTRVSFSIEQMNTAEMPVTGSAVSIVEECRLGAAIDCALPGHGVL